MHSTVANHFCWMDVKTHDVTGLSAFASAVFGWSIEVPRNAPRPAPVISVAEYQIGGVSDLANPVYPEGLPAHVACYLRSTDVDRSLEEALAQGGDLVVGPFDVPGQGRLATLTDPLGAGFSLWQPTGFEGWSFPPGLSATPHRLVLAHPAAARAHEFYRTVFGAEFPATAFVENAAAKTDRTPAWEVVLGVDDPEAVAARAKVHDESLVDAGIAGISAFRLRTSDGITLHVARGHD